MEYVALGDTGLTVSRLGFGGIPIQRVEPEEAGELLKAVLDAGINFIDTARSYTVSEERIGKAIEGCRERFVLATKSMARDRKGMTRDIEASLRSLRTDYIDLYQVHNPTPSQLDLICAPGGALEALEDAKASGAIGHLGVTAHSLEVFQRAISLPWVETVMFPYNIVETQGEALMEKARQRGKAVIAMKPLAGGAIEDAALALRFVLRSPYPTIAIPGMYRASELAENLAATGDDRPLSKDELARIDAIRAELGQHFCRRCNYCAPCSAGIAIPNAFLFHGYLNRYGLRQWAFDRYAELPVKAGACLDCGACETRCPYHLPIRQMLKQVAADFGA